MQVSEPEAERRRQEWIGLFQKNKFQRQDIVHAQAIAHQTRQLYCVEIMLDKVVTFKGLDALARQDGANFSLHLNAQLLCTKNKTFYGRTSSSHAINLYADKGRSGELSIHPADVAKGLNEIQFFFFSRTADADTLIIVEFEITHKT